MQISWLDGIIIKYSSYTITFVFLGQGKNNSVVYWFIIVVWGLPITKNIANNCKVESALQLLYREAREPFVLGFVVTAQ